MNQASIDELQRFTLADRVAVVAGGSGGVGVRTCGALAAVGAKVAIIGRSEERVVFTGDTVFSECQTWLMTSDIDQWVGALDQISALDVDTVVPGHGPVTTPAYLATQRAVLLEWTSAVAEAVAKGWSREETIARVDFRDKFGPVDVGQAYMMDHIQTLNAASLWDKYTAKRAPTR